MPEFEINNFQGIHRGNVKPPKNAASELRNFDLRGQGGVLEQRFGYGLAFDNKPEATSVANNTISFHNAESFYIPGVGSGQEITVQVGVGTLTSERITLTQFTQAIPLVWASHLWNGSAWVAKTSTTDKWNWLNETVCTRLYAVDPTTASKKHWIAVDILYATHPAGYFNGWYIANETEGGVLRIVDSFLWNDGVRDRLAFKLDGEATSWANPDKLYLMKNYIPITNLQAMGAAVRNDITFLKVRDELRIAFGAKANRIALAICYRKSYLNVKRITVDLFYSDPLLEAYCKTDGLIITPYTLLTDEARGMLQPVGSGTLPVDIYYVKITGVMDSGDEVLLVDEIRYKTLTTTNLYLQTYLRIATMNKRLKSLRYYYSSDTLLKVFYYLYEVEIQSDVRALNYWVLPTGEINIVSLDDIEVHNVPNAAAPMASGDPMTIDGWDGFITGNLVAVNIVAEPDNPSENCLQLDLDSGVPMGKMRYGGAGVGLPGLAADKYYNVSVWLKRYVGTEVNQLTVYFNTPGFDKGSAESILFDDTWTNYDLIIKSPITINSDTYLEFEFSKSSGGSWVSFQTVGVDFLSVTADNEGTISTEVNNGAEMSAEMGYTPSRNLIRSWDWGLVTAGRTFVSNAYIEKLYTNMIFYSAIGGDSNSMYDVLVAGLRYDVENFDGNDVKKIELLSNADFLLLQSNASQRLDPDSGRTASVGFGSGTVQPFGSVNFGDKIIFPSKYDILATSGIGSVDLSEDTIQAAYRALDSTAIGKMHGTKDVFGSAFTLYSGSTGSNTEYILTKRGWIERRFFNEPQRYMLNRNGELLFLSAGNIFKIAHSSFDGDNYNTITSLWQSIIFDAEAMGEQISADMKFVITDFFVEFYSGASITFKLYLHDGNSPVTHDTQVIPKTSVLGKRTYRRPLKGQATCSRFQLELAFTGNGGQTECSIYSVGVVYEVIRAKMHA
jgi:hypothetical protein